MGIIRTTQEDAERWAQERREAVAVSVLDRQSFAAAAQDAAFVGKGKAQAQVVPSPGSRTIELELDAYAVAWITGR